jgi:hypothetical protein
VTLIDGASRRRRWRCGAYTPAGGARQFRASTGAAPAGRGSSPRHSGGGGAPPGGTRASYQELADAGRFGPSGCGGRSRPKGRTGAGPHGKPKAVTKARPAAARKNAAMERRKARRPRMAGHLRPFPEMGSAERRAMGAPDRAPASPCASSPLTFSGRVPREAAQPARHFKRAAERWLFEIRTRS